MYITLLIWVSRPVLWAFSVFSWLASPLNYKYSRVKLLLMKVCLWQLSFFLTYISCLENNNLIQDLIDWISTAATQTVSFLANIGGIFCGHIQLIGGYHLHGQKVCLLWLEHVSETWCITFSAGFWFGFSAGIDFTQGSGASLRILHNFLNTQANSWVTWHQGRVFI